MASRSVQAKTPALCLLAVSCAIAALSPAAAGQAAEEFAGGESATIEDLAWLAGCWSMKLPDGLIEEHWLPPSGGAMLGLSRTVRGGRMKEYEFLALRVVDGRLAYVAIPSRQRETAFALTRFRSSAAIFENPGHDFPQRIIYRRTGAGITAVIEGKVKGAMRSSEYVYTRCEQAHAAN